MIYSSLKLKDMLEFDNGKISMPVSSSKLLGVVDVDEYDAYGRKLFSSRNINDITLPGSVFMLEQLFKIKSDDNRRFLYPNTNKFPTSYDPTTSTMSNLTFVDNSDVNIFNQRIFGFVVGRGGEDGANVTAPNYKDNIMTDIMPFQIVKAGDTSINTDSDGNKAFKYAFKGTLDDKDYYYVKRFSSAPEIYVKWADGSGDVNPTELSSSVNTPIVTYAQCVLEISATDIRDYYGSMYLDQCMVNQIGLVAGEPILDSIGNETGEFKDVKLLSCVNFKSRDLSNNENTLKITYKIYCL